MTDEVRPGMRASDLDREATAAQLRAHATVGRLTLAELDERLADAYAAKTMGDLRKLTSDLPLLADATATSVSTTKALPTRQQRRSGRVERRGGLPGGDRAVWGSYLSVSLMSFVIWLAVGVGGGEWYPWWLWVAGPFGALMLAREVRTRLGAPRPPDG
jgi:hypothetical protein